MALIGKLMDKLLTKGSITLHTPASLRRPSARPAASTSTCASRTAGVGFDIMKSPRLGIGEAYMDGRLIIEDGTILDLLEMVVGANRWEDGGKGRKAMSKGRKTLAKLFKRNNLTRARRNVAHHYDLKDELYELFLDADKQYSCAYFTDPKNSLEQAQADKKAPSPRSWR